MMILWLIPALLGTFGVLLCIGWGAPETAAPLAIIAVIGYAFSYLDYRMTRPNEQERAVQKIAEEKQRAEKKAAFYNECANRGITNCVSKSEIQKATLIAKNMGLHFTDISTLFEESKLAKIQVEEKEKSLALMAEKETEEKEYNRLNRYAEYYGKEKMSRMIEDAIKDLKSEAKNHRADASLLLRMGQEKENDWAVMGGIASGIAGTGAGIATALDAQAKNAQIRANNMAYVRAVAPAYSALRDKAFHVESTIKELQKKLEELPLKLISDLDTASVFDLLSVSDVDMSISETGAFTVIANVKPKSRIKIFDDVPAAVDGTITAHVFDGDKEIGTVKMVFPMRGISSKCMVVGMGLSGAEPGHNYTVTFEGYKLWLIEQ